MAGSIFPLIAPRAVSVRNLVRIDGENVLEYEGLQNLEAGHIELQAHDPGRWIEYKQIRIRRL